MSKSAESKRTNICYYITGHGLGHATRSLELIVYLIKTDLFNVHVVTLVQEEFFRNGLVSNGISLADPSTNESLFSHHRRSIDTGAVQKDVFTVDPFRTIKSYYDSIHLRRQEIIEFEVAWLKDQGMKLVLVDATPLACYAGKLAGVKTVLLSNFSWDFCFREMHIAVSHNPVDFRVSRDEAMKLDIQYKEMIEQCSRDSSACDVYLQYPGETPLPPDFPIDKVISAPLLARGLDLQQVRPSTRATTTGTHTPSGTTEHKATASGVEQRMEPLPEIDPQANTTYTPHSLCVLRAEFAIPTGAKVLLLGFGGHSAEWHLKDEFLPPGWICLTLGAKAEDMPSDRFKPLSPTVYVPNVIAIADAVLGKIGYGFVSECIRAGTVLIYVPRAYWPEERFLEKLLTVTYRAGLLMSRADFEAGNWESSLSLAVSRKNNWCTTDDHDPASAPFRIIDILKRIMQL